MTLDRCRSIEDTLEIRSLTDLSDWLSANHARETGLWLIHYKKSVPERYVDMADIVDELLCWGWIDSQSKGMDAQRTMHRIAPRNPKSNWSRVNKDKITRLEAAGRLQPPGQAMVDLAKETGTWTTLDDVENLVVPPDLAEALSPEAQANWDAFPRSVKRGALEILLNAKRAETRAAKIKTIADCAAQNQRPFQWTPR